MGEDQHREKDKLFHARIFRSYIEYLKDKLDWTASDLEKLLLDLNVEKDKIYDDRYWFDVNFSDQFYELIKERSKDPNIAYNAGTYVKKNTFSAAIYQLMRGLVSVGNLYRLLGKFTPHFTKAAKFKVVSIVDNTAILESHPNKGFVERPYMCENRLGIIKALPTIFGLPQADITHEHCVSRGKDFCRYEAKWKKSYLQVQQGSILFLTALLGVNLAYFFYKEAISYSAILISIFSYASFYFFNQISRYKKEVLDPYELAR